MNRADKDQKYLAASAIGVFVMILKETNMPLHKIIRAMRWAWKNLP